jgi:hypothetical protein
MSTVNAGWRGPNIVKEGLVLYLDAASGTSYSPYTSGTTWRDISGNNRTGNLTNGPTFSSDSAGSIVFDGIDDFVAGYTSVLGNTSTCTLEIICKFSSLANYSTLLYLGNTSFNHNIPFVCFSSLFGSLYFGTNYSGGGSRLTYSAVSSITSNAWHHCIGTMGGGLLKLYIDGVYKSSYTLPANYVANVSGQPIRMYGGTSYGAYTSGSVGLARVYNKELSELEVQQNYNSSKSRFGL